jgi:hypothetical protein
MLWRSTHGSEVNILPWRKSAGTVMHLTRKTMLDTPESWDLHYIPIVDILPQKAECMTRGGILNLATRDTT